MIRLIFKHLFFYINICPVYMRHSFIFKIFNFKNTCHYATFLTNIIFEIKYNYTLLLIRRKKSFIFKGDL